MTNNGMKKNRNSQADAEQYLEYLDGTPYTHLPGIGLNFNDRDGPNPFRMTVWTDGKLHLWDNWGTVQHNVLCQRNYCPEGKVAIRDKDSFRSSSCIL